MVAKNHITQSSVVPSCLILFLQICKGTSNPVFKETFLFRINNNELHAASITLQVFTRDHYARQKLVGEICVELSPMLYSDSYRTWSNVIDYDHQVIHQHNMVTIIIVYATVISSSLGSCSYYGQSWFLCFRKIKLTIFVVTSKTAIRLY